MGGAEGASVGDEVGDMVGAGETVGAFVGAFVGTEDGLEDGSIEGDTLGSSEGLDDGRRVGAGDTVGHEDGIELKVGNEVVTSALRCPDPILSVSTPTHNPTPKATAAAIRTMLPTIKRREPLTILRRDVIFTRSGKRL